MRIKNYIEILSFVGFFVEHSIIRSKPGKLKVLSNFHISVESYALEFYDEEKHEKDHDFYHHTGLIHLYSLCMNSNIPGFIVQCAGWLASKGFAFPLFTQRLNLHAMKNSLIRYTQYGSPLKAQATGIDLIFPFSFLCNQSRNTQIFAIETDSETEVSDLQKRHKKLLSVKKCRAPISQRFQFPVRFLCLYLSSVHDTNSWFFKAGAIMPLVVQISNKIWSLFWLWSLNT